MNFDPNDIALNNGNVFGFPCSESDAELIIIPIPLDITASYGKGTAKGPEAIRDASLQLDFFHPKKKDAWKTKVFLLPENKRWLALNEKYQQKAIEYIDYLENGNRLEDSKEFKKLIQEITDVQRGIQLEISRLVEKFRKQGKKVAVLGGEHSVAQGLIEALCDEGNSFGILQIDAHADLRKAYEGFEYSHASIMHNVLKKNNISKLVQVGVRDLCPEEKQRIDSDERIVVYFDWDLKERQYLNEYLHSIADEIISYLPQWVYVSFDIDGLSPDNCPDTGTPVPGGLSFSEAVYILRTLKESGRELIGFDLCEVAPGHKINAIVGARILWELVNLA